MRSFSSTLHSQRPAPLAPATFGTMTNIRNAAYAALPLRVSLGARFLAHGLLKVFVFTLPGTAKLALPHSRWVFLNLRWI
ncbi:hypothetical+protein [Methylocapsa aurea]